MTRTQLIQNIKSKGSFLCIGLDTELSKIPPHLLQTDDPVFEFNKAIIDATFPYAVAYKPNIAFYESMGIKGWNSLLKTTNYIQQNHPDMFIIADAKRGDIGNTSAQYARTFFDKNAAGFDFNAVTVAPYMGEDSVKPFMAYENKWVIILALTSNKGAGDFQYLKIQPDGQYLFEQVLETTKSWGTINNIMYVVGATQATMLKEVRRIVPEHFLLVPGIGAQGGDLSEVAKYGLNSDCGLLVNASRSIIYASSGVDFAQKAALEAQKIQQEMSIFLKKIF